MVASLLLAWAASAASAAEPGSAGSLAAPRIGQAKLSGQSVACFERIEVDFAVIGDFDNPFDPRQVEVDGLFQSPDGKSVVTPAFLYQDASRELKDGSERVELVGDRRWKVRFAPTAPGRWRVAIRARNQSGTATSDSLWFEATAPAAHGYVRHRPGSDYFSYDDGTPFFIIGENIAWAGRRGTYDFDDWLPAAGRAGMNLARIWLQWNQVLSIEHNRTGAGRYDLANAWRMDYVLDLARKSGVRVMFTCDSPEPYQKEHYWLGKLTSKPWENCPHNAANGGPLREPEEFYTTEEGHRLIRQRLRYIVARWGWDPNIFCWELWNELNCFPGWEKLLPEIASWHVEMAGVLRNLDPNKHLVTTSFGFADGHEAIWNLQELDFVQSHSYGGKNMAGLLPAMVARMKSRYGRPHLIGEFGPQLSAEMLGTVFEADAKGVHLHNALWSTALGGSAGTALTWWWDNYIHPKDLYGVFTPLARFCEGVPWTTAGFRPVKASVSWSTPPKPEPPRDLVLECQGAPQVTGRIALDPHDPPESLGRFYLYGRAQRDQQKPIAIELDRAVEGPLVLHIGRVWNHGSLTVKLDGRPVLERELPAGPGEGPWKRSELDPRWKIWGADYDEDLAIAVPAGKHTVELFNGGKDGITIDRLHLPAYAACDRPPIRTIGLLGNRLGLVWIQNARHTLAAVLERQEIPVVDGAVLRVEGIPAGRCTVEWWDTSTGAVKCTTEQLAGGDGLSLAIPSLATDIACKVRW
ncbi:MAG: DUF5060 domain-containing protein [Pirellulales bacterium]|nr:DUF5060 domain-containing protein [Pirellulales bacterium]